MSSVQKIVVSLRLVGKPCRPHIKPIHNIDFLSSLTVDFIHHAALTLNKFQESIKLTPSNEALSVHYVSKFQPYFFFCIKHLLCCPFSHSIKLSDNAFLYIFHFKIYRKRWEELKKISAYVWTTWGAITVVVECKAPGKTTAKQSNQWALAVMSYVTEIEKSLEN